MKTKRVRVSRLFVVLGVGAAIVGAAALRPVLADLAWGGWTAGALYVLVFVVVRLLRDRPGGRPVSGWLTGGFLSLLVGGYVTAVAWNMLPGADYNTDLGAGVLGFGTSAAIGLLWGWTPDLSRWIPVADGMDVAAVVRRTLDSPEFLTALRATLPTGKDDQKYGFDHVPYLLHTVSERRERSFRAAQRFLTTTISFGILFVVILTWLGYVLVDESSVGVGRAVQRLASAAQVLSNETTNYRRRVDEQRRELAAVASDAQALHRDLRANRAMPAPRASLDGLSRDSLRLFLDSIAMIARDRERPRVNALQERLNRISIDTASASFNLSQMANELRTSLTSIRERLVDDPDVALAEILKRLAIGLVVSSFLLAVLTYLARMYNTHLQEVTRADRDDLSVRRFYVAFRCASNDDHRKTVLREFLRDGTPRSDEAATTDIVTMQQQLLADVTKKLVDKI